MNYIGYIYKITLPNNKSYIGSKMSSIFVEEYWGSSGNKQYWKDLEFYGKENCKREILCWCKTKEDLLKKESNLIVSHNVLSPNGYNLVVSTFNNMAKGYKMSQETVKRRKETIKNKSKEEKKKTADKFRKSIAKYWTLENREKQSKRLKGKLRSEETKQKMRKPKSENAKQNMSKAQKGLKKPYMKQYMIERNKAKTGKYKWWNNGIINKFCEFCPEGFKPGKVKKTTNTWDNLL